MTDNKPRRTGTSGFRWKSLDNSGLQCVIADAVRCMLGDVSVEYDFQRVQVGPLCSLYASILLTSLFGSLYFKYF